MNSPHEDFVFKRFLTLDEQRKLLSTIKQFSSPIARRDAAVCQLLIGSGMRVGECLAVSCADAADALQSGYLFVPKEHRKKSVRGKAKSGDKPVAAVAADLSVYLTKSVREALLAILSLREGAGVNEALIVSRRSVAGGKAMTVRAFELRVAFWARQAGLPEGVSPHWFRHTHAKNIVATSECTDPLRIVQARLGQISRRSTEIYTKVDREEMAAAMREVDGKVHGKPRVRVAGLRKAFEGRVTA
jgi:site-specific recombinase XerC